MQNAAVAIVLGFNLRIQSNQYFETLVNAGW